MARLAFAIDGSIDIWDLRYGYSVEPDIARAIYPFIGKPALIYRNTEVMGGYFGLGRPISIAVQPGSDLPIVTFDDIEMFSSTIDYLIKVPVLSRIQLLDDDEFETIVRQSNPQPVIGLAERASQPFIFAAPDLDAIAFNARVRRAANGICAFTGEQVGSALQLEIIWPRGAAIGFETDNVLPLSQAALDAFHHGHFSARDDLTILVDGAAIDRELLGRINPTGRLIVPADPDFHPAPENLAYHRRFKFGLA